MQEAAGKIQCPMPAQQETELNKIATKSEELCARLHTVLENQHKLLESLRGESKQSSNTEEDANTHCGGRLGHLQQSLSEAEYLTAAVTRAQNELESLL